MVWEVYEVMTLKDHTIELGKEASINLNSKVDK